MPEGPSIVILKEEILALHLTGKPVIAVAGNTSIDKERMLDQKVLAFKSWGKHFLVCFEGFALRIHLMLFGTYRINERKDKPVRLRLNFEGAELNFYTCSLQYIEGDLSDVYDWSADIMAPEWSAAKALKKLEQMPEAMACDLLLNQDVFAGSGNIIKNEVLYRTGIHPLSIIAALPRAKVKALIKETHTYAFQFLEWKKEFTLKQHWLAYAQQWCKRCNLPMHKESLGKTRRRTFYCDHCQQLWIP